MITNPIAIYIAPFHVIQIESMIEPTCLPPGFYILLRLSCRQSFHEARFHRPFRYDGQRTPQRTSRTRPHRIRLAHAILNHTIGHSAQRFPTAATAQILEGRCLRPLSVLLMSQHSLYLFPGFPTDNRRMVVPHIIPRRLSPVGNRTMRQKILCDGLLHLQIPHIFLVSQYAIDGF